MSKSLWLQAKILDASFGNAAWPTVPGTWYIALFTTLPTESTDSGVEVSGGSYVRKSVVNNATNFPAATQLNNFYASKKNGTAITFATSTAGWGIIKGFGLYDASSGGNLWYWGATTGSFGSGVGSGVSITIGVGSLEITET